MRALLAENRATIAEISEAVGLNRNTIGNLRNGIPTVRCETLEAVCNYLQCTPWDLFPWVVNDEE